MNESVSQWDANKYKLLASANRTDSIYSTAMNALVRADEAMAEIGTASFKSTSNRGKRLEDTLNKLRADMYEIAATATGSSGGGALTSGMFYDELNNAISSVDATIEDGLKLDYRLRELQSLSQLGADTSNKPLFMPYKYSISIPDARSFTVPTEDIITFVQGDVTVLNNLNEPMLDDMLKIIVGTIDDKGHVQLTSVPKESYQIYFPVRMKLKDIPEDFLYLFMQQMIQKNSRVMETVLTFENQILSINQDIEYMKGVQWTPDFSIMRNHQELVKEGITPKGLDVEVQNGLAHVTFSYDDHPHLSHFVIEKWDESTHQFIPYDGNNGIVSK